MLHLLHFGTRGFQRLFLLSLLVLTAVSCRYDAPPASEPVPATHYVRAKENVAAEPETPVGDADGQVWICQSAGAKRYHYDANCRGLKRCTHSISRTTVDYAERVGLTLCKYED